jgi:hypothetical protein
MKTIFFILSLAFVHLAWAEQPTEPNAVVDKPTAFTLPVSELAVSSFTYVAPNGARERHVVTSRTQVMQGEKAAVFGDIKLGDIVTGLRVQKPDSDEWEILKIKSFTHPAPPAAR